MSKNIEGCVTILKDKNTGSPTLKNIRSPPHKKKKKNDEGEKKKKTQLSRRHKKNGVIIIKLTPMMSSYHAD